MIVVEGPDGGGKSTLIEAIREHYPTIRKHERASEGVAGPVDDLYGWAARDLRTWDLMRDLGRLFIYDRHPLVSEYIYGPVIRGTLDPRFCHTNLRRYFARDALVIVCLPPLEAVRASVSAERDMPGVTTHIDTIWHLYASLRATWPNGTNMIFWDYTKSPDIAHLFAAINSHRNHWSPRHV